jgi:hypothetical protein
VHGSNARNLSVEVSLSQVAKMLCLSYYCSYLFFNKIGEKWKTGSDWNQGGGGEGGCGREGGEMAQTMYAHMNKWIKKKKDGQGIKEKEGGNESKIHCKHFCKCYSVP